MAGLFANLVYVFVEVAVNVDREYRMVMFHPNETIVFGGVNDIDEDYRYVRLGNELSYIMIKRESVRILRCSVYIRDPVTGIDELVRNLTIGEPDVSIFVPEVKFWVTFTHHGNVQSWREGNINCFPTMLDPSRFNLEICIVKVVNFLFSFRHGPS